MVKYETPDMEVIYFVTEDIVTTSGGPGEEEVPFPIGQK